MKSIIILFISVFSISFLYSQSNTATSELLKWAFGIDLLPLIGKNQILSNAIQEKEVVKYMPNPTSDNLNVIINKMDEKATYHYDMIDINGRMVLNGQLQAVNQIDATLLPNGIYILKITKDDLPLERQKIIIQH